MQHVGRIFGLMLQYLHSGRVPGRLLWPLVNSRWSDIENLLRCLIATVTPIGPYLRAYTENLFSNWHFDVTCGTRKSPGSAWGESTAPNVLFTDHSAAKSALLHQTELA